MKHQHFWKDNSLLKCTLSFSYLPYCGHISCIFWDANGCALLIPYVANNLNCMFWQHTDCIAQGGDKFLRREIVSGCCAVGISKQYRLNSILHKINKVSHFTPNRHFFLFLLYVSIYFTIIKQPVIISPPPDYFTNLLYPHAKNNMTWLLMYLNMQRPSFAGLAQHAMLKQK